jgi:hypothetical protein
VSTAAIAWLVSSSCSRRSACSSPFCQYSSVVCCVQLANTIWLAVCLFCRPPCWRGDILHPRFLHLPAPSHHLAQQVRAVFHIWQSVHDGRDGDVVRLASRPAAFGQQREAALQWCLHGQHAGDAVCSDRDAQLPALISLLCHAGVITATHVACVTFEQARNAQHTRCEHALELPCMLLIVRSRTSTLDSEHFAYIFSVMRVCVHGNACLLLHPCFSPQVHLCAFAIMTQEELAARITSDSSSQHSRRGQGNAQLSHAHKVCCHRRC